MATPHVPPRPARSQHHYHTGPQPVRPEATRQWDRAVSPAPQDAYARSPLNDSPFAGNVPPSPRKTQSRNSDSEQAIQRRPSVQSMPSVGQEGMEYASLEPGDGPESYGSSLPVPSAHKPPAPNQTSTVAPDLPLHAPKASMSPVAARNQVAPVTRADSAAAADLGIGKPQTEYGEISSPRRPPSARSGHYRPPSTNLDRPGSVPRPDSTHGHQEEEKGIPEIGARVPMYPNAGDVQAPSPAVTSSHSTGGVAYFSEAKGGHPHDPNQKQRRRSSYGFYVPPGSYGLHGHGVGIQDNFEKQWYQKHPEELEVEKQGAYGPHMGERGAWAMSSDELNKLVRDSGSRGPGMGTNPDSISIPPEQIGFLASEEYSSRMATPHQPAKSETHGPEIGSPLRKSISASERQSIDEELDNDRIHIDEPPRLGSKVGGGGYDPPTEDLGPEGGNSQEAGGWVHERGAGTPILASDEVAKYPAGEHLHPAVSPEQQKHGDEEYYDNEFKVPTYRSGSQTRSRPNSRPNSRPSSIHGGLSRYTSHEPFHAETPLQEIDEYEPLFPDEEKTEKEKEAENRFKKRPGLEEHRFPSMDIWEDTPTSLQLHTTVSGPQEPVDEGFVKARKPPEVFEPPEKELERKGEVLESERAERLLDPTKKLYKPKFHSEIQREMDSPQRPGLKQRFPSSDIWEDTPDSLQLHTTVDPSRYDETAKSPPTAAKPSVPPRPAKRLNQSSQAEAAQAERQPPAIPDRPKPKVPMRPGRGSGDDVSEESPLSKSLSGGSTGSAETITATAGAASAAAATKTKPTVPPRPGPAGNKLASIKAGFINDLNSRLQLGPQAPKKAQAEEAPLDEPKEEEKLPLADVRRGRARGPTRRKPAASPGEEAEAAAAEPTAPPTTKRVTFSMSLPQTVWHVPNTGSHHVVTEAKKSALASTPKSAAPDLSEGIPSLARNTAGETLLPTSPANAGQQAIAHPPRQPDMVVSDARLADEAEAKMRAFAHEEASIGFPGDVPQASQAALSSDTPEPIMEARSATPPPIAAAVLAARDSNVPRPRSPLEKHTEPMQPLMPERSVESATSAEEELLRAKAEGLGAGLEMPPEHEQEPEPRVMHMTAMGATKARVEAENLEAERNA